LLAIWKLLHDAYLFNSGLTELDPLAQFLIFCAVDSCYKIYIIYWLA